MSAITKMFFAYGVMVVVSLVVALLIKFMTSILSGLQRTETAVEIPSKIEGFSKAITSDGETIAAIAASVYAVFGTTARIVLIRETSHILWRASNRLTYRTPYIATQRLFQKIKK